MSEGKAVVARPKVPLDKRPDFGKILGVAGLYTTIAGLLNGIAVYEVGTPVGYTSGPCVNAGRFLAAGDPVARNILGICTMFYVGGIFAGITGDACDGDAVFEGRMSPGMLFSSFLLALGAYAKRQNRPWLACQLWSLSQGILNGISSRFSAAPIRATHTAGGQTDAAMTLGNAWIALTQGKPTPPMRKVILNIVCCFGMIFGGFGAHKIHAKWGKQYGAWLTLIPAAMQAFAATALPAMIAPAAEDPEDEKKTA